MQLCENVQHLSGKCWKDNHHKIRKTLRKIKKNFNLSISHYLILGAWRITGQYRNWQLRMCTFLHVCMNIFDNINKTGSWLKGLCKNWRNIYIVVEIEATIAATMCHMMDATLISILNKQQQKIRMIKESKSTGWGLWKKMPRVLLWHKEDVNHGTMGAFHLQKECFGSIWAIERQKNCLLKQINWWCRNINWGGKNKKIKNAKYKRKVIHKPN